MDMQPVKHWALRYSGIEEPGLNKMEALVPGGNTVQGVEAGAAQEEGSIHGVEDHSFLYVMN